MFSTEAEKSVRDGVVICPEAKGFRPANRLLHSVWRAKYEVRSFPTDEVRGRGESRNTVGDDPSRGPESVAAPATVSGEPSCKDHWTPRQGGPGRAGQGGDPRARRRAGRHVTHHASRPETSRPSGGRQEAHHDAYPRAANSSHRAPLGAVPVGIPPQPDLNAVRCRSILVTGGARSGKSAHAERLVAQSGLDRIYLATSVVEDGEMRARVAQHVTDRGSGWETIEEPVDVARA